MWPIEATPGGIVACTRLAGHLKGSTGNMMPDAHARKARGLASKLSSTMALGDVGMFDQAIDILVRSEPGHARI